MPGLKFFEVANADAAVMVISAYTPTGAGAASVTSDANGYAPNGADNVGGDSRTSGDIWFRTTSEKYDLSATWNGYQVQPTWFTDMALHEIGHTIGFKHPGNYSNGHGSDIPPYLPAAEDDSLNTVMSYYGDYAGPEARPYDILAAKYLYGEAAPAGGTWLLASDGNATLQGSFLDELIVVNAGTRTVDGGGGVDTVVYSGNRAGFTLGRTGGGFAVTDNVGSGGTQTLANVERLVFADAVLDLETTAPVVVTFNPADAAAGIVVGSDIVVTFSEAIQRGQGVIELRSGSATGTLVEAFDAASSARLTVSGSTLTVDPTNSLGYGTHYFLTFVAGSVLDDVGNSYAGTNDYDFTTAVFVNSPPTGFITISGTAAVGQTLSVVNSLADADGLGLIHYQWKAAGSDINGATADSFVVTGSEVGKMITVTANYVDGHGTAESVTGGFGKGVELLIYSWKIHTLLEDANVSAGAHSAVSDNNGVATFFDVGESGLALGVSRNIPAMETAPTSQAVNLQDAIAILKMIVGLDVNGGGKALSPYQALAADYDGNGSVQLSDAIGILKHVVGLSAPDPSWLFFNEVDATIPGKANLNPGPVPPTIGADVSAATAQVHVGLVGVLRGDVDGSFSGGPGSQNLDVLQPAYIADLARDYGLPLSQFGVYP